MSSAADTRERITEALGDLAHVVEDRSSLSAMVMALKLERSAMIAMGQAQHRIVVAAYRFAPELKEVVEAGERVFG